jgi:tetratricopeptide (TPR) repeat protein
MTDISHVLEWLNPSLNDEKMSHLSSRIQSVIDQLRNDELPLDEAYALINRAIVFSQHSLDEYEYPEVLLNCAVVVFLRDFPQQARFYIIEAGSRYIYLGDQYRKAVTSWLLGLVNIKLNDPDLAYTSFDSARKVFQNSLAEDVERLALVDEDSPERSMIQARVDWFIQRLISMEIHLVCLLEEIHTWLSVFRNIENYLSVEAKKLRREMEESFQTLDYLRSNTIIEDMEALADRKFDHTETPNILVYTGMIRFRLGQLDVAIKKMRQAVEMFLPGSHEQCIARWMLGMVQFTDPVMTSLASKNCENAIQGIKKLLVNADYEGKNSAWLWYSTKIPIMEFE